MPSPFPGMNPYLENPELWPEVHSWLIVAIADVLGSEVRPKYRVAIGKRVYQMTDENSVLVGIFDVVVGRNLTTEKEQSRIAVASPPTTPITVTVPMPLVDLQPLLHGVYDRAGFDLAIDYTREPVPPLLEADALWAKSI